MNWGSVADWVSGVGSILASFVALYLAGSQRRAMREGERPGVSIELNTKLSDGWAEANLTITNTSYKDWLFETAEVLKPTIGRVITDEGTMIRDGIYDVFSAERRNRRALSIEFVDRTIRSLGTMPDFAVSSEPRNRAYVRLHLYLGDLPAEMMLRLRFASLEPKPDRFFVDVPRTIRN